MASLGAELVDNREILPGQWQATLHAPSATAGVRAGQYLHLRTVEAGLALRRPLPIVALDAATGAVSVQFDRDDPAAAALAAARPGDDVEIFGPFGRPFEVDPRSRHLLLVAQGPAVARLRLLAEEAVRDGRQVTLLFGAPSAREVHPSSLLPDEVEYVVATEDGSLGQAGSVVDLVGPYEAWADQAFAAAPAEVLATLAGLAASRRRRLGVATLGRKRGGGRPDPVGSAAARRRAFLQVALPQPIGCAAGTCLGCAVAAVGGPPVRVCREGPVFAAEELDWEPGTSAA